MQLPGQSQLRSMGTGMLILTILVIFAGGGVVGAKAAKMEPSLGKAAVISSLSFVGILSNMAWYYLLGLDKLGPNWQVFFQIITGLMVLGIVGVAYCNSSPSAAETCMNNAMLKRFVNGS